MSFARQPLDAILGSVASVRAMRALSAHGGPVSVTRLVRDTRVTPNGVRDALRSLERAGVVEAIGSGRSRLYRTLAGNPLAAALECLFAEERKRFDEILEVVAKAAKLPEVVAVWLFGSVARAEDVIDSDIDVAVVIDARPCEISRIADIVRDRLLEKSRTMAFSPSVVSMTPAEVRQLKDDQAPMWTDLVRDTRVLVGPPPETLLRSAPGWEKDA